GGAQRASAPPRRFNGTPSRCEACHADAHEGAFHARQAQLQANRAGTCAECHGTTRFDEAHGFQHGHFTGFALVGAHAESDCATCHAPEGSADALGRTFGRAALPDGRDARAAREDGPLTCAVCHADPHAGAFNARDAEVASGADCARCHGESSFRDMNDGFDHGHETGFALEGAHARAACSACHTPLEGADASGRTTARAAGTRCADCHADPHAGQFTRATPPLDAQSGQRKAPQTTGADCARCHSPRGAFAADSFEHEWDTNFPLDGAHAALACAACHRPEQWTYAGREVEGVRYRPLGMDCVDCHGEQAGALRRRVRGKGR
ncbi:MAG: hypothetical protein R3F49_16140, partial [Planctomycetota bacterium]